MSIYKGTQLISGVATPVEAGRNIGQIIQSLLPITDAGLHLLDGTVISGNGIYKAFVDYIKTLDLTASYFTTEADWQASVTQYGVCGKFVYDASANTVRLPKVTGLVEGTIDASALGDLVEAGLPNITGTEPAGWELGGTGEAKGCTGAFYNAGGSAVRGASANNNGELLGFDASKSNSIYGNSNTVQPQAIKGYYYIVVATSAKTDIEVDIDNVITDLNNKVDISNMVEVPTIIEISDPSLMPSWYRVWSDGWCEQGGIATGSKPTVTFIKPFINTNYYINWIFQDNTNTANLQFQYQSVNSKTSSSAVIHNSGGTSFTMMWEAKGYIR